MLEQEIVFRAYIDKFIARIGGFAKEGKPCEMTSWFNFMTFDVIGVSLAVFTVGKYMNL